MRTHVLIALIATLLNAACAKTQNESDSVATSYENDAAASATDFFSKTDQDDENQLAAADDNADLSDVSAPEQAPSSSSAQNLFCQGPARAQQCVAAGSSASKIAQHNNCLIQGTRIVANGFVKLDFNSPVCSASQTGDVVVRTYDLTLSRVAHRGSLHLTSSPQTNYLGAEISGGERYSKTASGFTLEVLGSNRNLNLPFRRLRDISVHTASPIEVTKLANPGARIVNGGPLKVDHNLARFTAAYKAVEVTYDGVCRCPVSGKLEVEYTGSSTAQGYVEFKACGQAIIQRGDRPAREIQLRNCQ